MTASPARWPQRINPGRRWSWWVVALVLSTWAGLVFAGPAEAHNVLRGTSPADHATVDVLPDQVVLTFDQPSLAVGTEVTVTGPDGAVSSGAPQLVDTEVRQHLDGGPAGGYTVRWRATSADGHPISGVFTFTTREGRSHSTAAGGASAPQPGSPAAPASSAGSTGPPALVLAGVLALALAIGAAGFGVARLRARRAARDVRGTTTDGAS